jgi:hypothetical protein
VFASVREMNERIDDWFEGRPLLRWLVLAFLPGAVYAPLHFLAGGDPRRRGITPGVFFGVTPAPLYPIKLLITGPQG